MKRVLSLALLLSLVSMLAVADGPETGTLQGTVLNVDGTVIPGVLVTITSGRGSKSAMVNAEGKFRFVGLLPGEYTLQGVLESFSGGTGEALVAAGKTAEVNLNMGLSAEAETIIVTSEAPMVNKYNISTGGSVASETVGQVAAVNRGIYGSINVLPGVTNDQESQDLSSSRPSFNGTPWSESAVFIDGVDTTFTRYGATRMFVPTSATTEVSLEVDGKGVEYGRSIGGVTNVVVKSGTNNFHGEANGIYRNLSWDANFNSHPLLEEHPDRPRPADTFVFSGDERDVDASTYEASFGGPIKRDKAWFFIGGADFGTFTRDKTLDGTLIDQSTDVKSYIAKFNFQPGDSHQLGASWISTPITRLFQTSTFNDIYTPTMHDIGGRLGTVTWNWSASSNTFIEFKLADQTSSESKEFGICNCTDEGIALAIKQLDPRYAPVAAFPTTIFPDSPSNNFQAYLDLDDGSWSNGWVLDNGYGRNDYPRDQANVSGTHFVGANHEFKWGIDYQQTSWEQDVSHGSYYYGFGFDAQSDDGYDFPYFSVRIEYDAFKLGLEDTDNAATSTGTNIGYYVRDRWNVGDHLTLNLGFRLEDQLQENDFGREVIDSVDFSPRVSAVWDIKADGKQLITFSAGRYHTHIPQETVNTFLLDGWNGFNAEDRFQWNWLNMFFGLPGAYTGLLAHGSSLGCLDAQACGGSFASFRPGTMWDYHDLGVINIDIEPYGRDEWVLGYEWQFSDNWAFIAKYINWETFNQISNQEQMDAFGGGVFQFTENFKDIPNVLRQMGWLEAFQTPGNCSPTVSQPDGACGTLAEGEAILNSFIDGKREYQGGQFQLNKRFRNGWALFNHVTLAKSEGNVFGSVFNNTDDSFMELAHLTVQQDDIDGCLARNPSNGGDRVDDVDCVGNLTPHLGESVSGVNRFGNAARERDWVFRSYGFKIWNVGKHTLNLGGQVTWQDGVKWSYSQSGVVEGSDRDAAIADINSTLYVECRACRKIDDHYWMNLSGAWGFPLGKEGLDGEIRLEITNVLDDQDLTGVRGNDGRPGSSKRYWTQPRKLRLLATLRF